MTAKNQSIFLKAIYLEKELEEINSLFMEHYDLFFKEVEKTSGELYSSLDKVTEDHKNQEDKLALSGQPNEEDDKSEDPSSGRKTILKDKKIKSLYTRIVTISHPDKHANYLRSNEKEKLTNVYKKCISSAEDNNLFGILSCAKSLYLDIPELSPNNVKSIEDEIISLQEGIEKIKNTYIWHWATSERKEKYINMYIKSREEKWLSQK